jgi:hypothetical protein
MQVTRRSVGSVLVLFLSLTLGVVPIVGISDAQAADGTLLRTITAENYGCGTGTGLAFDGSRLLLSCWSDNVIRLVNPENGADLGSIEVPLASSFGALAWDRGRNRLWACDGSRFIERINLANGLIEDSFSSEGCIDGLAYDGSDDTIWSSDDAAPTVEHYKLDGTLISSTPIGGKLGNCGNSGIAVGGTVLLLSNNGCSEIYKVAKDFSTSTLFATYPARLEDLECDDVTFANSGQTAIWSKDAYDGILNAWQLDPGTCGYGGFASSADVLVRTEAAEPSMATNPSNDNNAIIGSTARYSTLFATRGTCGWSTTQDAGSSWNSGELRQWPAPFTHSGGDASVAYSSNGTAFLTCLAGSDAQKDPNGIVESGVVIARSTDGGKTFGAPTVVHNAGGATLSDDGRVLSGIFDDQEQVAVHPNGRPYVCWTQMGAGKNGKNQYWRIAVAGATDQAGTAWGKPTFVSGTSRTARGCSIAITPTGRIWAGWWDPENDKAMASYTDRGLKNFTPPQVLGTKVATTAADEDVLGRQVWIRADPRPGSSTVAAAWATGDPSGAHTVVARTSGSGGWQTLSDVGTDISKKTRQPALAYGADGSIAVGFYDQIDSDTVRYAVARAATASGPFKFHYAAGSSSSLSKGTTGLEPLKDGLFDYTSVAILNGQAWGAWTDDRNGQREIWTGH